MRGRLSIVVVLAALVVALVPGVAGSKPGAEVLRDSYGVPHIYADDATDLFRAMGYASAHDRLWQAEVLRRSATGRMAEILGPSQVAQDIQARTLFGPAPRRAELLADAPADLQEALEAYAAGVNDFIGEGDLPVEFGVFGYTPEPWTVDDSVAVFMLLGSQFGWFGSDELTNAQLWQALQGRFGAAAPLVLADLLWLDDPDADTTVPATGAVGPKGRRAGPPADLPAAASAAAGATAEQQAEVDAARREAGVPTAGAASNAMVISSRLSRSGAPLLLGGPQMGYTAPQINHEVGLHGAGFDVTGMSIAGVPLVPIGVGNGYAWTLTSGGSDNSDIYVEVLNPADPTQYLHDGEWMAMDCRQETIHIAGGATTTTPACTTIHGPVIFNDGTTAFALKNATFGKELTSLAAWMNISTAKNIADFESGLADVAYNFNVLYADHAGNIAYWHVGHIPVRADGVNPLFPADGTGGAEWHGIVPFGEMPHSRNPDQGWLASWNNKPAPGWANSSGDFWMWGGAHRVATFMNQAEGIAPRSATPQTLMEVNRIGGWTTDTPTGQASSVFVSSSLDDLLQRVDVAADPRLPGIVAALGGWDQLQVDADGDGFYDGPEGAIFNAWWFAVAEGVFDEVWDLSNRFVVGNLVDRMLKGADAGLPLGYDYLGGATVEEAVTAALVTALDELAVQYGSDDPATWLQPISVIHWSPVGVAGVPDTIWMNRGTYNQIVHLRGRLEAWNVISPGQSGDPTSPHFSDQLELYATWQYKSMLLRKVDVRRDGG